MSMEKITKGYPNWDVPYNFNVDEYNNTIGNAELKTEDKTLKGAINEVKGSVDNVKDEVLINTSDISNLKTSVSNNTAQLKDLANERGYARVKRFEVETDLNALTESGVYASAKFLNGNGNDNEKTWKIVEAFNMSIDNQIYCIQRIMGIADGGDRTFERRCNNGIWSEWIQLCYAKLENTTFSVSEGYTATLNSIKKDSNGRCIIYGIIKKTDGAIFNIDVPLVLGVMPQGFIPIHPTNSPIRSYRGNVNAASSPSMLLLDNNGNIVISNTVDNTVEVQFTLIYDTK